MTDAQRNGSDRLGLTADEVLTTTRAVRRRLDFDRPVSRTVVEDCVRVAQQAPSGRNRQHWDFVIIDDPERIGEVSGRWRRGLGLPVPHVDEGGLPTRMPWGSAQAGRVFGSLSYLTEHIHRAPMLLIPCLRVTSRHELTTIRGQAGAWGPVVPSVWSFMLAARERGLGTAWTTSHLAFERQVADVLGIPYETTVQAMLTPIAYTRGTRFGPGPRADHRTHLHWNRW